MLIYINEFLDDQFYLDVLLENKKIFKHLNAKNGPIKKQIEDLFNADDFEKLYAPLLANNEFPGDVQFSIQANYISLTHSSGSFVDDIGHYLYRTRNYIYNLLEFHGLTRKENYELEWFKEAIESKTEYNTRKNYGYLLDLIEVNNDNTNGLEWICPSDYNNYPEEFIHSIGDGETWEYYLDRDGYEQWHEENKEEEEEENEEDMEGQV